MLRIRFKIAVALFAFISILMSGCRETLPPADPNTAANESGLEENDKDDSTFGMTPQKFKSLVRGLRVEPGYFYNEPEANAGMAALIRAVVKDSADAGFNTLFVFSYAPEYGAFYRTSYPSAAVEAGYGQEDLLPALTEAAHAAGLKVIAGVPVNNFKQVWTENPTWRIKKKDGSDYRPDKESFLLSPANKEFQQWYSGFVADLIVHNPKIDGVEAVEGVVDVNWNDDSDYNPEATKRFMALHPDGKPGDYDWKKFRSDEFTHLYQSLAAVAKKSGILSFVVQTWTATKDGQLMASESIQSGSGFDFEGILKGSAEQRPDYIVGELLWQQWRALYGNKKFDPKWTETAGRDLLQKLEGTSIPMVHIELSPFTGQTGTIDPTNAQLRQALRSVLKLGVGYDIYDYHLMREKKAFDVVRKINRRFSN